MKSLNQELTVAEQSMFRGLGWEHLFDTYISAPALYKMAVEKAFTFGIKNKYTHALREANFRLYTGEYRGNEKHDATILEAIANYIP